MPLLLNQLVAVSVRLVTPWTGAWFADVDFDLDETMVMPSGPAGLTLGTTVLLGTIDDRASGRLGTKAKARVVGGGGGWDKAVSPLHFHNDAGVLSTLVRTSTALEVGELLVDASPSRLGVDYVRTAGPASRVLAGVDWYVTPAGVTTVGPRLPLPLSPLVDILNWNPNTQTAELAGDEIVMPGTILVDTRFGTATIRDIEQTFDEGGARATAWCGGKSDGQRLLSALSTIAREATGSAYLKIYKYRVVLEGVDERLTLQAVRPGAGAPDSVAISMWPGMSGLGAKLTPGTIVLVQFIEGDPTQPIVCGFEPAGSPLIFEINALHIALGLGTSPVALSIGTIAAISALQAEMAAVAVWAAVVTAGFAKLVALGASGPETPPGPFAAAAAAGGTVATAISTAGASAVSAAVALLPSTRTFSD